MVGPDDLPVGGLDLEPAARRRPPVDDPPAELEPRAVPLGHEEVRRVRPVDPDRPRPLLEHGDGVGGGLEDRPAAMDLVGIEDLVGHAVPAGAVARPGHDRAARRPPVQPARPGQERLAVSPSTAEPAIP